MSEKRVFRDEWSGLTDRIIGAAIAVHRSLGPGFLEATYQKALVLELRAAGSHTSSEVEIPVYYRGVLVGRQRLDLVVASRAVVELKAVTKLDAAHFAQVRAYLAASHLPVGLLINFAGARTECRRVFPPHDRGILLHSGSSSTPAPDHAGLSAPQDPRD